MEIITTVLGGLGLFLFGMNMISENLQKTAGNRLQNIIYALTKNVFMSVIVGALVTMLLQSSSGTSVMVISFVNAGMMNLTQATGVLMGAAAHVAGVSSVGCCATIWAIRARAAAVTSLLDRSATMGATAARQCPSWAFEASTTSPMWAAQKAEAPLSRRMACVPAHVRASSAERLRSCC